MAETTSRRTGAGDGWNIPTKYLPAMSPGICQALAIRKIVGTSPRVHLGRCSLVDPGGAEKGAAAASS